MAAVTQCDVCNNVVRHQEAKLVKIFNYNHRRDTSSYDEKDVCPVCYDKLKGLLGMEDTE